MGALHHTPDAGGSGAQLSAPVPATGEKRTPTNRPRDVLSTCKAPPRSPGDNPWAPPQYTAPARAAYAAGLVPDSHTRTLHTHNMGHYTDHYRHRKATEDPYLIPALRHSNTATAEPTAPRSTCL